MKKYFLIILALGLLFLQGCSSLRYSEKVTFKSLEANGITMEKPAGPWERPTSPVAAALLNILPGCGNFYLATGDGADDDHFLYGFLNMITWPLSWFWGIPEAGIDAGSINRREFVYFYTFHPAGQNALDEMGLEMRTGGYVVRKKPVDSFQKPAGNVQSPADNFQYFK